RRHHLRRQHLVGGYANGGGGHDRHHHPGNVVAQSIGIRTAGHVLRDGESAIWRNRHRNVHGWRHNAWFVNAEREQRRDVLDVDARRRDALHHRTVQRRWFPHGQHVP